MAELLRMERVWAGYGDAIILEDISFNLAAGDSLKDPASYVRRLNKLLVELSA